jgi:uncharacterized delta-60 repeat protein
MKTNIVFFILLSFFNSFLLFPIFSKAQNGSLDLSFGNAGKVITDFGANESAYSVAIQSDGKIVVAGTIYNGAAIDFAVTRYNTDGSLDNSFGIGGKVTTDIDSTEYGTAVAIQADGKIVVVGYIVNHDFVLVRYNTDGTLDNTFGNGGKLVSDIPGTLGTVRSVVIQSDGKIVVGGDIYNWPNKDIALIRYNTDGSLDNSFGTGGIQTTAVGTNNDLATSIALQNDGKIVISASSIFGNYCDLTVLRYNTNGSLDNTFGNAGIQTTSLSQYDDYGMSVAIQSDGKIVVGGTITMNFPYSRDFLLARYNTDGTLDNTFGNGGIYITYTDSADFGQTVAILPDGKIVLGGRRKTGSGLDFVLACYNTNGTLDTNFGIAGIVTTDIASNDDYGHSSVIQNDGKIVMAGFSYNGNAATDFAIVRYNYTFPSPEGIASITDQSPEIKSCPSPFSEQTTLQTNKSFKNATLRLFNSVGQQVKQLNQLSGREIKLDRNNLPAGFYSFHLLQENKSITTGRLIISDR